MSVVLKQYNILKGLDLERMKEKSILSNSSEMIRLQQQQIRVGKDENKASFKSYVSKEYSDYKSTLSSYLAPPPTPDLYYTGNFQDAIFVKIDGKYVIFDSSDDKAPKLKKKYKPFGLQQENIEKVKIPITNNYTSNVYKEISS